MQLLRTVAGTPGCIRRDHQQHFGYTPHYQLPTHCRMAMSRADAESDTVPLFLQCLVPSPPMSSSLTAVRIFTPPALVNATHSTCALEQGMLAAMTRKALGSSVTLPYELRRHQARPDY